MNASFLPRLLLAVGMAFPSVLAQAAPVPANDSFANGTLLTGERATVLGSNTGASKEPGEPNHAGDAGGRSVWWTWTAPFTGSMVITTEGSPFDTLLAVYS